MNGSIMQLARIAQAASTSSWQRGGAKDSIEVIGTRAWHGWTLPRRSELGVSKTIRNIVRTCSESILDADNVEPSVLSLLYGQALVPLSSSLRSYQPPEYKSPAYRPLTAHEQGFTLHAATRVAASNPCGLFRLCAYGARGAIASSRLSRLPSGTFAYQLKRPLSDGRKTIVWTGEQLVRKLVPLIPPPFANLTRFHGVFAPRAKLRARVVAQVKVRTFTPSAEGSILDMLPKRKRKMKKDKRYRLDWASLLSRIFAIDVMTCAQCKGKLRIVAKVDNRRAVAAMLRQLGIDQDPNPDPTTVEYECGPQLELAFDFGA